MKTDCRGLIAVFVACWTVTAAGAELRVDQSEKNLVKFTSKATMESFSGQTGKIDGYILFSGEDSLDSQRDLSRSGIKPTGYRHRSAQPAHARKLSRNRQISVGHLSGQATKVEEQPDQTYLVTAQGKLTLHGISKEMPVTAKVAMQGPKARVMAEFSINLNDYKISVPKMMFMKVSETMQLLVDFYITTVKP